MSAKATVLLLVGLFCGWKTCAAQFTKLLKHCPLNVLCLCGNTITNISYHTIEECQSSHLPCHYCQPGNQTLTEGLHCKPFDQQCILYGTPTAAALRNRVAPGYTLFIKSLSNRTSTVTLNSTSIQLVGDLTIVGVDPVNVTCPLTFEGASSTLYPATLGRLRLTLTNLTLKCVNNTSPIKPGILIQNVQKIEIVATNVTVTNDVQSAITVLGGLQDGVPSQLHVDLGESVLTSVRLLDPYVRMWVDVTLAMYYTSSDRGITCDVDRLMVQPALNPATDYASPIAFSSNTIVYNLSEWTRIFGVDYEVLINDDATFGFELTESSKAQQTLISMGWGVAAAAAVIIVVRYSGPVYYMSKLSKVI